MRKKNFKKDYLLQAIPKVLENEKPGTVLDIGCGEGHYAYNLTRNGFQVTGVDVAPKAFKYHDCVTFKEGNIYDGLPFEDGSFDYALFLETIEHMEKPFEAVREISRVLKQGGKLIISTPNILNLGSRLRFLCEGSWDFFREPPLEQQEHYAGTVENLHIIPWRYHEMEYMLYRQGFVVEKISTDWIYRKLFPLFVFLFPLLAFQRYSKEARARKKGGVDYRRINQICFSKELMFGKHMIIKAINTKKFGQSLGYYQKRDIPKYQPSL